MEYLPYRVKKFYALHFNLVCRVFLLSVFSTLKGGRKLENRLSQFSVDFRKLNHEQP